MRQTEAEPLEERGVYWARYRKGGLPVMYAVDSRGDVIRSLAVKREWDVDRVSAYLWGVLDDKDPIPKLALVRDEPSTMDPRLFVDEFTQWRRGLNAALKRGWRPRDETRDLRPRPGMR